MTKFFQWTIFIIWAIVRITMSIALFQTASFNTLDILHILFFPWSILGIICVLLTITLKFNQSQKLSNFVKKMLYFDTLILIFFFIYIVVTQPMYFIFLLFGTILFASIQSIYLYQFEKSARLK
jgi:hypothetical protein